MKKLKEHKINERGFILKRYKEEIKSKFQSLNSLEFTDNKFMNQVATKETNRIHMLLY
jgi:adenine-specific DNA-methyltransferase